MPQKHIHLLCWRCRQFYGSDFQMNKCAQFDVPSHVFYIFTKDPPNPTYQAQNRESGFSSPY
jgi:hypothetical protein